MPGRTGTVKNDRSTGLGIQKRLMRIQALSAIGFLSVATAIAASDHPEFENGATFPVDCWVGDGYRYVYRGIYYEDQATINRRGINGYQLRMRQTRQADFGNPPVSTSSVLHPTVNLHHDGGGDVVGVYGVVTGYQSRFVTNGGYHYTYAEGWRTWPIGGGAYGPWGNYTAAEQTDWGITY